VTLPPTSAAYQNRYGEPPIPESTIVRHVRETLPLVLRLSPWRFAFLGGLRYMIFFGIMGVIIGVFVAAASHDGGGLWFAVVFVAVALFIMPFLALEARKPVLGADEAGIWVKVMRSRKAVFLPWAAVALIEIRKFGTHHELCVVARDPAVDAALAPVVQGNLQQRAGQAIVNRRSRAKLGTNIHTPLTGAPMSHEDLLAKLRYYAAGRCPVG
jgi:hypothetical protein